MTSAASPAIELAPRPALTGFLQMLFAELAARDVRYCVLHSYEELPEHLPSDLDIAVTKGQMPLLAEVFTALGEQGYHPVQCLNYEVNGYYFVFAWTEDGALRTAAIDFISEHREGNLILTSGEELILGRRRRGDFWIPSAAAEFRYLLSKKVLKGSMSLRQSRKLAELAMGTDAAEAVCERLFGRHWGALAAQACENETLEGILRDLKKHLWIRVLERQPWMPLWYRITDCPRIAARLFRPTGLLLALLGPDGVGKSTLLANLADRLKETFRALHRFHWRPGVLFAGDKAAVTDPHARPCYSPMRSVLHLGAHIADFQIGFVLRILPAVARTGLVLFDRYFYDLSVDSKRYRYGGPAWLPRALFRAVPSPDLVLILDAPAETVLERKRETTLEETQSQRERYLQLEGRGFRTQVIDASQSPDRVAQDACQAVIDVLRERFAQRHGRWLAPPRDAAIDQAISVLSGPSSNGPERRFTVFPGVAQPRWLIPAQSRFGGASPLSVYTPYTMKASLMKAGLSAAMRTPLASLGRQSVSLPDIAPLRDLALDLLGVAKADFSISLGTPGRYRKATVQISVDGRVVGFLKVPLTAEARARVEHEAEVLARLSLMPGMQRFLPAVLFAGKWNGSFALLQVPLGGKQGGVHFTPDHRMFLDELARVEPENRPAWKLIEEIDKRLIEEEGNFGAAGWRTVSSALRFAQRTSAGLVLPCGVSHGDFAPWNIRRRPRFLGVFDWESAGFSLPQNWDAFHFQTQTSCLLGRDAGYRFDREAPETQVSYLLYLIHSACLQVSEQGSGCKDVQHRLRCMRQEISATKVRPQ
jgi:thymidylate kinase